MQERTCKGWNHQGIKNEGNIEKQLFALYSALCHLKLCEQAKASGFHLEESCEARTALHLVNQLRGMLMLANATATIQGCSKDDQPAVIHGGSWVSCSYHSR
jgi:hypothetical protein